MKKAGRILSMLLAFTLLITMVFAVSSCGSSSNDSKDTSAAGETDAQASTAMAENALPEVKLKEEYKIGVISFDYVGQQGKELKQIFSYLEKEFGVKFIYATAQPEEAQVIKAVEDLCAADVDGILNLMWNKKAFEVAANNKVYMARILNTVLGKDAGANDEGYDEIKTSPYYVGSTSQPLNTTPLGEAAAQAGIDAGLDNFGVERHYHEECC